MGGRTLGLPARRLTRSEVAEAEDYPEWAERPRIRGDCECDARPCPFASCRYHLYLEVNPLTGAIKFNFPGLEVWELGQTCALDVADMGGLSLEDVGILVNVTRERIRQLEIVAVKKLRDAVERYREHLARDED